MKLRYILLMLNLKEVKKFIQEIFLNNIEQNLVCFYFLIIIFNKKAII